MGGYWLDDGSDTTASGPADPSQTASCKLELDETARCYRRFFVGKVSVPPLSISSSSSKTLSPSPLTVTIDSVIWRHFPFLPTKKSVTTAECNQKPQRSSLFAQFPLPFYLPSPTKGHQCNRLNGKAHVYTQLDFPFFLSLSRKS